MGRNSCEHIAAVALRTFKFKLYMLKIQKSNYLKIKSEFKKKNKSTKIIYKF